MPGHTYYHYLNRLCPICNKTVSPYYHTIVKGVKYHVECWGGSK